MQRNIMNDEFKQLTEIELYEVTGGKNTWQGNVIGSVGAVGAGAALGGTLFGPAGAFVGAHYGTVLWASATGATGGF